jgi:hypothetical protein
MQTLQDRLDELKSAFESGAPPYNAPRETIETSTARRLNSRRPVRKSAR